MQNQSSPPSLEVLSGLSVFEEESSLASSLVHRPTHSKTFSSGPHTKDTGLEKVGPSRQASPSVSNELNTDFAGVASLVGQGQSSSDGLVIDGKSKEELSSPGQGKLTEPILEHLERIKDVGYPAPLPGEFHRSNTHFYQTKGLCM